MSLDGVDRILGELKEFKRATVSELNDIKKDLRALQEFKWRLAGGAAVLAFALTGVIELVRLIN